MSTPSVDDLSVAGRQTVSFDIFIPTNRGIIAAVDDTADVQLHSHDPIRSWYPCPSNTPSRLINTFEQVGSLMLFDYVDLSACLAENRTVSSMRSPMTMASSAGRSGPPIRPDRKPTRPAGHRRNPGGVR